MTLKNLDDCLPRIPQTVRNTDSSKSTLPLAVLVDCLSSWTLLVIALAVHNIKVIMRSLQGCFFSC